MAVHLKTRREFIKESASATAAGLLYMGFLDKVFGAVEKQSRVVLIRNEHLLDRLNQPRPELVSKLLDEAVTVLLNMDSPIEAWRSLVSPDDIIGIKSNEWRYLPTTTAVEQSLRRRLLDVGMLDSNMSINDRGIRSDPVFQKATGYINARPMRTHHWSGVGSLIKNYITFVEKPWTYHDDACADLGKIWLLPQVHNKTRLNILVMFTPLFHGFGPHHFNPKYTWVYNGIIVGQDPVAVDAVGVRILEAKRRQVFGEERHLNPPPKHIFLADTRHHLGTADPERIELIRLGWQKDILI